ncbi:YdbH domain-containing protein [Candidatus Pacearchaeota archaeon]|nr:YdbH domain-containing protein [Candidatus Pacearchaeota archaeon]
MPKKKFILRFFFFTFLFLATSWVVLSICFPIYIQKSLLPSLADQYGIDTLQVQPFLIGVSGVKSGFILGANDPPVLTVSSIAVDYSFRDLFRKKIKQISLSGVEFHCKIEGNKLIVDDTFLQNLLLGASHDKPQSSSDEFHLQLPFEVEDFSIRQATFILRKEDQFFRIPFDLKTNIPKSGPDASKLSVFLKLYPLGQQFDISANFYLNDNSGDMTLSSRNINLHSLSRFFDLPSALNLESKVALSGNASLTLSPLSIRDLQTTLVMRNSSVQIDRFSLTQSSGMNEIYSPLIFEINGAQKESNSGWTFQAIGSSKHLTVEIDKTLLHFQSPKIKINGFAIDGTVELDSLMELPLHIQESNYVLNAPEIEIHSLIVKEKDTEWQAKGKGDIVNLSFNHMSSKTNIKDAYLNFDFNSSPSGHNMEGVFGCKKIKWQGLDVGGIGGNISLLNNKFNLTTNFHSNLLPGLVASAKLTTEINNGTNTSTISLNLPPYELSNYSMSEILPKAKGISVSGVLAGNATINLGEIEPSGQMQISLNNGSVSIPDNKISVSGIDTAISFPEFPFQRSDSAQKLTFTSARVSDLQVNGGDLIFTIESPESLLLEQGNFKWAEGSIHTYDLRFSQNSLPQEMILYCNQLKLASVLGQLGLEQVKGEGTVSGRIPIDFTDQKLTFSESFLYSTPGSGGSIKIGGDDFLTQAIPHDTPQFAQLDFVQEALRNFRYDWAKLHMITEQDDLVIQLKLDGKPDRLLPFVYDKKTNFFKRTTDRQRQGISRPIRLDVNFRFPLNTFLDYDKNIKDMLKEIQ